MFTEPAHHKIRMIIYRIKPEERGTEQSRRGKVQGAGTVLHLTRLVITRAYIQNPVVIKDCSTVVGFSVYSIATNVGYVSCTLCRSLYEAVGVCGHRVRKSKPPLILHTDIQITCEKLN